MFCAHACPLRCAVSAACSVSNSILQYLSLQVVEVHSVVTAASQYVGVAGRKLYAEQAERVGAAPWLEVQSFVHLRSSVSTCTRTHTHLIACRRSGARSIHQQQVHTV